VPALAATDHRDAHPLGDAVSHLRQSRPGEQHRYVHLGALDDHLGREPPGGVEDLVAADDVLGPHPAGDRIDGIVPAHVLDELEDLRAFSVLGAKRATVHRTGKLVDRLVPPHQVHDGVERRFGEAHRRIEPDGVDVGHQVAEHGALAAAGGDGAMGQALGQMACSLVPDLPLPQRNAGVSEPSGRDRHCADFPVDLHARDGADVRHQALVAQVAQREMLRRTAQRHQRHQFALVEVERERMLPRHRRRHFVAALVDRRYGGRRRPGLMGQGRQHRSAGQPRHPPM
jgi:hypothetical protein